MKKQYRTPLYRPRGLAVGKAGELYVADTATMDVFRVTPDGKAASIDGFPPKFFPRQIAAGPDNTIWVTMEVPGENIYEVAKMNALLGLPVGRVQRINPLSIFFIMQAIISVAGGASAALFLVQPYPC